MSTNPPAFIFPTRPTAFDRMLAGAYSVSLTVLTSPIGGARLPDPASLPEANQEPIRRGSCADHAQQFGE